LDLFVHEDFIIVHFSGQKLVLYETRIDGGYLEPFATNSELDFGFSDDGYAFDVEFASQSRTLSNSTFVNVLVTPNKSSGNYLQ
jgi:hypothetical protein